MQTFDDVLSQLVTLLRRSDAGGFVPRPAKAAGAAAPVVSYRSVYRCPSSTWGEGGYVPEAVDHLSECRSACLRTTERRGMP